MTKQEKESERQQDHDDADVVIDAGDSDQEPTEWEIWLKEKKDRDDTRAAQEKIN